MSEPFATVHLKHLGLDVTIRRIDFLTISTTETLKLIRDFPELAEVTGSDPSLSALMEYLSRPPTDAQDARVMLGILKMAQSLNQAIIHAGVVDIEDFLEECRGGMHLDDYGIGPDVKQLVEAIRGFSTLGKEPDPRAIAQPH